MRDLDLNCDFTPADGAVFSKNHDGDLVVDVNECGDLARVIYKKEKAAQLRDWLNEFLEGAK